VSALLWQDYARGDFIASFVIGFHLSFRRSLIISTALPKGIETFDLIDGVYAAHPRCAVPDNTVLTA
jgi:hypothetical protein